MTNLRDKGNSGEEQACEFLENSGFTIIDRNFHFGKNGEIDIIAQKENLVLFVEVKSRDSKKFGGALYSINQKKKSTLRFTANGYLIKYPQMNKKNHLFRFDLIAIEGGEINWVKDIIR